MEDDTLLYNFSTDALLDKEFDDLASEIPLPDQLETVTHTPHYVPAELY